jgi:hypothetical protein
MPVSFGATNFSLTAPTGYLQESSQESVVELATIRDQDGKTVIVQAKPRSTVTTTVKAKGDADFTPIAIVNMGTTATVTGSKVSQTNDDFTTAEITYTELN